MRLHFKQFTHPRDLRNYLSFGEFFIDFTVHYVTATTKSFEGIKKNGFQNLENPQKSMELSFKYNGNSV